MRKHAWKGKRTCQGYTVGSSRAHIWNWSDGSLSLSLNLFLCSLPQMIKIVVYSQLSDGCLQSLGNEDKVEISLINSDFLDNHQTLANLTNVLKSQVPQRGLEMKLSFHSDCHFLLVTPPKWFRECLLVFLDILYDLQASLERSGWLNSTPARCPSAPVEHPFLRISRMLSKLSRLPIHVLHILWFYVVKSMVPVIETDFYWTFPFFLFESG